MEILDRYRTWYEHECDANDKMLTMMESVPKTSRSSPQFQRTVQLAAHLAACRENWLDRMAGGGLRQTAWWPEDAVLEELRPRYAALEDRWINYLNRMGNADLEADFEFPASDGRRYRWNTEGQIVQLFGHAFYHRGQIAQIVEELGGETVDTDYLFWAYRRDPKYGPIEAAAPDPK